MAGFAKGWFSVPNKKATRQVAQVQNFDFQKKIVDRRPGPQLSPVLA
jgi:hypothetical protein